MLCRQMDLVYKWCWKKDPHESVNVLLCNLEYRQKLILKLKSRENTLLHNICFIGRIILKFCAEHDSDTVTLHAIWRHTVSWTQRSSIKLSIASHHFFLHSAWKMVILLFRSHVKHLMTMIIPGFHKWCCPSHKYVGENWFQKIVATSNSFPLL